MTRIRWACLVLFSVVLLRTAWLSDDALITLRTVLNVTHGYGLTFNIAERVQTFTHPLWLALETLVYLVVGNVFYTLFILSIATSLLVFGLVMRAARTTPQVWIATGVLVSSRAFVDYSTSGLENPLTALVTIATLAWVGRERRGAGWLTVAWCGVSAAYLTRPDAVLLVLPAALWAAWQVRPRLTALRSVMVGLVPALLWTLFSLVYYGFPFPNTAYAKLATNIPLTERVTQGVLYLFDSLNRDPITLATIAIALFVAAIDRSRDALFAATGLFSYVLYVVWVGGDFMSGRFLAVPVLLAVWLMVRTRTLAPPEWRGVMVVLGAVALASPHWPLRTDITFAAVEPSSTNIVDERAFYYSKWGLLRANRQSFASPDWPRWDGQVRESKLIERCGAIGDGGLESGPHTYMLDDCGLVDPLMARLPPVWKEAWRPGHHFRFIPDGYGASVVQNTNALRDPGLAEYYGHLRKIVRGDHLWSSDRLRTIVRMNRGKYDAPVNWQYYAFGGEVVSIAMLSMVTPDGTPLDASGPRMFRVLLAVTCDRKPGRRMLDVALDSNDRYRLTFLRGNRDMGHVDVDPVPSARRVPGLASHLVTIPGKAREGGFDAIVIFSIGGDEQKGVGHLLLDGEPATAAELSRRAGGGAR